MEMEGALRSCVDIESLRRPHRVDFDKHKPAYSKQSQPTITYIAETKVHSIARAKIC